MSEPIKKDLAIVAEKWGEEIQYETVKKVRDNAATVVPTIVVNVIKKNPRLFQNFVESAIREGIKERARRELALGPPAVRALKTLSRQIAKVPKATR